MTNPFRCISSVFRVEEERLGYKVKILSEINNLDSNHLNAKQIYEDLEQVFARMLPAFEEVTGLVLTGYGTELEVIVKIQCAELVPGDSCESQVVGEGTVENIVGTGIYFYDTSPLIQGGALEMSVPIDNSNQEIRVFPEEDTMIVFSQMVPSRITKLFCSFPEQKKKQLISTLGHLVTSVGLDDYTSRISSALSGLGGSPMETKRPEKCRRQFVSFSLVDPTDGMKVPKGAPTSSRDIPVNVRLHHLRSLDFPDGFSKKN